jgi:hypothetical protein
MAYRVSQSPLIHHSSYEASGGDDISMADVPHTDLKISQHDLRVWVRSDVGLMNSVDKGWECALVDQGAELRPALREGVDKPQSRFKRGEGSCVR